MLRHAQFNSDVLPDSYKKPYLIKVTSEWCFACVHIEPVWKETVQELEPLGEFVFHGAVISMRKHAVRRASGLPEKLHNTTMMTTNGTRNVELLKRLAIS